MKVILQKDVKDVGRVGELVNVRAGFARNFLFPRKLAKEATERRVKELDHLKKVAELKMKKAFSERKDLLKKLDGVSVSFKLQASENDRLFGSVTALDVSRELDKLGFSIDKKSIRMEPIKIVGQHKAEINLGADDLKAQITVSIEALQVSSAE
jgi:large subunit ribosomal protein L9